MVADAIVRYRLDDDSKDPELVQAIKDSAGTLYAGEYHWLLSGLTCVPFYSSRLTTSSASAETVCFTIPSFKISK